MLLSRVPRLLQGRVSLRAGALAERAGVHPETLRYYERRGLLAEPGRSPGGHRLYPESAVARIRVIKAAQRLGFTLTEVGELLGQDRRGGRAVGLQERVAAKLVEVEHQLAQLAVTRDNLVAALAAGCLDLHACLGHECCPIPFAPRAALVDDACTLPQAEQPARVAEFERLLSEHVTAATWVGDRLRLTLSGPADLADVVRDLTARESQCCAFFAFTVAGSGSSVVLEVGVPPGQRPVLDAIAARAGTVPATDDAAQGLRSAQVARCE